MTSIVRNGELIPEATATVIVDVDLEAEIPCEEIGECRNPAVWRVGRLACGCQVPPLVCQTLHEYMSRNARYFDMRCEFCGHKEPTAPWLARWVRL